MIDVFRQEFEKLLPEEKTAQQAINSLKKPCQIEILTSPSQKFHILVKTTLDEIPDKTIKNIILSADNYIDEIEDFYKNKSSIDVLDRQKTSDLIIPMAFAGSLRRALTDFGKNIRTGRGDNASIYQQGIGGMMMINEKLSVWDLHGNLESIDFTEEASKIVMNWLIA